jgi:hypothetical protein
MDVEFNISINILGSIPAALTSVIPSKTAPAISAIFRFKANLRIPISFA